MRARELAVHEIGWKARRLVVERVGATVVAALSRSLYLDVEGALVWLGPPGATLHPRAVVAGDVPPAEDGARIDLAFDLADAREWRPARLPARIAADQLREAARRLLEGVDRLGPPGGFGTLVAGRPPAFPLDRAAVKARRFLDACARDDAHGAALSGQTLLGLGPGLTPAGDDLVGGAVFACRLVGWSDAWERTAAHLRAEAHTRTHRISATLLADLLDGDAHAPLHELAVALACGDADIGLSAAARLVGIGHSSGWDLLAGFLGALGAIAER